MGQSVRLPRGSEVCFGSMPLVMGIINVTPDSFSDGGEHFDSAVAIESGLRMLSEGAAMVDIGGESTRPGALPVDDAEEIKRVVPVIRGIRAKSSAPISIDTRKSAVAAAALDAGADMINDVSALRHDSVMSTLAASRKVPVILMHMRGEPKTMQNDIHFDDLIAEVHRELVAFRELAERAGIAREQILVDPGIGFGKTFAQNAELLRRCADFADLGPVVIGASRKAFVGELTGQPGGAARAAGSLATVAAAALGGAAIVRVHDVRPTVDFLKVFSAVTRNVA
jgi:dihydropteroate synthase